MEAWDRRRRGGRQHGRQIRATGSGLTDPAYDPYIIGAGAYNTMGTSSPRDDVVAPFSARSNGCAGCKNPDLVAPGIAHAGPAGAGKLHRPEPPGGCAQRPVLPRLRHVEAAAITSGVVALLLQKYPDLTPDQVKSLLTSTRPVIPGATPAQGSGAINLPALALKDPTARSRDADLHGHAHGPARSRLARGSDHITQNGVALTGNKDIFGKTVNSARYGLGRGNGLELVGRNVERQQLVGQQLVGFELEQRRVDRQQLVGFELERKLLEQQLVVGLQLERFLVERQQLVGRLLVGRRLVERRLELMGSPATGGAGARRRATSAGRRRLAPDRRRSLRRRASSGARLSFSAAPRSRSEDMRGCRGGGSPSRSMSPRRGPSTCISASRRTRSR